MGTLIKVTRKDTGKPELINSANVLTVEHVPAVSAKPEHPGSPAVAERKFIAGRPSRPAVEGRPAVPAVKDASGNVAVPEIPEVVALPAVEEVPDTPASPALEAVPPRKAQPAVSEHAVIHFVGGSTLAVLETIDKLAAV